MIDPADLQPGWKSRLLITGTGTPKPVVANALLALREAPEWVGVLALDEFSLKTLALKPPPWLMQQHNHWQPLTWSDACDVFAAEWLQRQGINVSVNIVAQAVEAVANEASFHPIRDYLNGLTWDEEKRIACFAEHYLGAETSRYHRVVSQKMFLAAVARVYQPGCKADHMVILEGSQGLGKSSAAAELFGNWFSDDLAELGSKDAQMQVRGAWGIEVAELASMHKGEQEKIKAFISRRIDRFRPAYGRRVVEVPRQSVFIGTTNADTYLKDDTGARRFWPIKCTDIDLAAIKQDRDQLWAEAVAQYRSGKEWWFTSAEDHRQAHEQQEARRVIDAWHETIEHYCEDLNNASVDEILERAIGLELERRDQRAQNRVAYCLIAMGWQRLRAPKPNREGKRPWRYYRPVPLAD